MSKEGGKNFFVGSKDTSTGSKSTFVQTPGNTICIGGYWKGAPELVAGYGSDGKVHCFKANDSGSTHNSSSNTKGENTSSYPYGGNHGNSGGGGYSSGGSNKNGGNFSNKNSGNSVSYTGNSNSQGLGKEYNYTEVLGTAGHVAKNVYGHSATVGYIIDFCKKKSGDCWGSNALNHGAGGADSALYVKAINLNSTDMDNNDAGNLFYVLQDFNFNLDIINLSNNKLGNVAVESMIYGITSVQYQTLYSAESGWKPYKSSLKTVQNVISINLSNNQIGDDGAKLLADYLAKGSLPSTKSIDLSGNKITNTGNSYFVKALNSPKVENLIVVLAKEAVAHGKEYIKNYLKTFVNHAKEQGVDTTYIATNKSAYEYFKNGIIVSLKMGWGYFKCSTYLDYVEDGVKWSDVPYEVMIYKIGKKFPGINQATCFFQSADEAFTTTEGINLIGKAVEFIEDN